MFRRSSAVEQLTVNQLAVGSIPTAGANLFKKDERLLDQVLPGPGPFCVMVTDWSLAKLVARNCTGGHFVL